MIELRTVDGSGCTCGRAPGGLQATLHVVGVPLEFRTTSADAHEFLRGLPGLFETQPCAYAFHPEAPGASSGTVVYVPDETWRADFCRRHRTLTLAAPWAALERTTLLRMCIWLMVERELQRRGFFSFHASAVSRHGGIVMLGEAEAGKTTMALELCARHGFSLAANDQATLTIQDNSVSFHAGDPYFRFRRSSLVLYSQELTAKVFGDRQSDAPWNLKEAVAPEALGLKTAQTPFPVRLFVFLRLDAAAERCHIESIRSGGSRPALFLAKKAIGNQLAASVRGATFVPFDEHLGLVPLHFPTLDDPEIERVRWRFVETLFESGIVVEARGPLHDLASALAERSRSTEP